MLNHYSARTRWLLLGAVAVVVAAAAMIGVIRPWTVDGPRLVSRTNGSTLVGGYAPGSRQPYFFAAGQVCLDGTGSAKIRSVKPVDPHGGLTVTDFAVLAQGSDTWGADRGRLPANSGTSIVAERCQAEGSAPELFIEIMKPRPQDAWANAFEISYELDGRFRTERVRFAFGVCEKDLDTCDTDAWTSDG